MCRWISRGTISLQETIDLANDYVCVWTRSGPFPLPGSDPVRVPFRLIIPERIPPSFSYWTIFEGTHVRYSVAAVGVRKGALTLNKKHLIPLPILPRDDAGAAVKDAYASYGWKTFTAEDKIRKGLWGDYSKVHVEVRTTHRCFGALGADTTTSSSPSRTSSPCRSSRTSRTS